MFQTAMDRSRELFSSGLYCAESVLLAVAESRGTTCKSIPRIATGFCSGLARTGGPCGAMTGAVLAISLALGRDAPDQSLESCYLATRETINGFESRFGSDNCLTLTGCHLGTDEGQERFKTQKAHERCLDFVVEATRLAMKSIADHSPSAMEP